MSYNDPDRLKAVKRFLDLDIDKKAELEEMVYLAASLCDTIIATITLMDEHTEYYKYKIGTEIKEMLREQTFFQYGLDAGDIFIVPDTLADERFAQYEQVLNTPFIRFYAAVPLITHDGYTVGSLSVSGTDSKNLTELQKSLMGVFAKRIVEIMELELSLEIVKQQFLKAKDSSASLLEIARIQSHELRKPVSTIIGFIELIRSNDYITNKEEMDMLSRATTDLDNQIRKIVNLTQ